MSRLDQTLVERGLCESREKAKRLILAGQVRVNGHPARKASDNVKPGDEITVDTPEKFVSRGGHKLEHALEHFSLDVTGLTAIDLGASTGGFTDCLLQHGAARVFAVDVGQGQLAWKLRQDPRVVVMEKTNARYLTGRDFAEPTRVPFHEPESPKSTKFQASKHQRSIKSQTPNTPGHAYDCESGAPADCQSASRSPACDQQVANLRYDLAGCATLQTPPASPGARAAAPPADLIVVDCSFISLKKILPPAAPLLKPGGRIVALIKPQFEAGKAEADKGRGVITDAAVHKRVLVELEEFVTAQAGLCWRGVVQSPLLGPAGNKEFLALIEKVR